MLFAACRTHVDIILSSFSMCVDCLDLLPCSLTQWPAVYCMFRSPSVSCLGVPQMSCPPPSVSTPTLDSKERCLCPQ